MPEVPPELTDRLARLRHAFLPRSRGEASRLSELQRALLSSDPALVAAAVGEIHVIAHRLRGTAGTLGFAAITEAAAEVEDAIDACGGQSALAGLDLARVLAAPIQQLVTVIEGLAS